MAERGQDWQQAFLQAHALPPDYLPSALKWFAPVAQLLVEHQGSAGRSILVGINGSQGSGKTTLSDYLVAHFRAEYGLEALALSLDDFYLTLAERESLAEHSHPLFLTRGVPGTHDMALLQSTLQALLAGETPAVPRFDKAIDDRRPECDWDQPARPVDIILLEGWCLGAQAVEKDALVAPINALEREQDADGQWRRRVNNVLARPFPELYALVDQWLMLKAPSFDCVYRWRLEQEQKLAAFRSGRGVMSAEGVAQFVQFYQRITEQCLADLPGKVNHLFTLDEARRIESYLAAPGVRL
ncbi:hypothetical protein A3709_08535 [Halioglobus sp. HI00S01]|uniref:hypothetical protein n=1 Tax=Halioglobus sp. HI00S01 TaxID=1822214 RepID=UPI0007C37764|nr:hypothetical protein [Halioglobus sp. HI00S01]KZX55034.1 hypothetical protein A3709_08535 [Halioglobus sp. HI00S01]